MARTHAHPIGVQMQWRRMLRASLEDEVDGVEVGRFCKSKRRTLLELPSVDTSVGFCVYSHVSP